MGLGTFDNGRSGKGLLFVISSVSGGGKTTVINALRERMGDLRTSVSHTTRSPRSGEVPGMDYHFTDRDDFEEKVREGLFLEWAEVYGQYYGTLEQTVASITSEGVDAVLDIDVQGAMQVRERRMDAVLIFILPPGEEEQERRLRKRGTESETEIRRRIEAGRRELAFAREYHYSVTNDDIEDAVNAVSSIIRAERCRNR